MVKNHKNGNRKGKTSAVQVLTTLTDGRAPFLNPGQPPFMGESPPVYILSVAFCGVEYPW